MGLTIEEGERVRKKSVLILMMVLCFIMTCAPAFAESSYEMPEVPLFPTNSSNPAPESGAGTETPSGNNGTDAPTPSQPDVTPSATDKTDATTPVPQAPAGNTGSANATTPAPVMDPGDISVDADAPVPGGDAATTGGDSVETPGDTDTGKTGVTSADNVETASSPSRQPSAPLADGSVLFYVIIALVAAAAVIVAVVVYRRKKR